jgi:uncharacterized membrane protein
VVGLHRKPGRGARPAVAGGFRALQRGFLLGADRTATQDVEFVVDQLVDVAVRALSPGINDPATAQVAVERLGAALCQLAGRDLPSAAGVTRDAGCA